MNKKEYENLLATRDSYINNLGKFEEHLINIIDYFFDLIQKDTGLKTDIKNSSIYVGTMDDGPDDWQNHLTTNSITFSINYCNNRNFYDDKKTKWIIRIVDHIHVLISDNILLYLDDDWHKVVEEVYLNNKDTFTKFAEKALIEIDKETKEQEEKDKKAKAKKEKMELAQYKKLKAKFEN